MADYYDEPISDKEKLRIASDFIMHAPPGELNEVFNDVRTLVNNDTLLKAGASRSFASYNKEQFTPVKVEGSTEQCLVTDQAELGGGFYLDPRSKQKFMYDHLRKEANEFQPSNIDENAESWRSALETEFSSYVKEHYNHGVCSVYGKVSAGEVTLTACIEDHQFEPRNFWNGRWRSRWQVTFSPSSGSADMEGLIRVQVHYYEDGNVQLVSSKEVKETLHVSSEMATAKAFTKLVKEAEGDYQAALSDNYQTMSDTTCKALRRQLPVTRSKIDWNKILSYKIGIELKNTSGD